MSKKLAIGVLPGTGGFAFGLLGFRGEPMSGKPRLDLGERAADAGCSLSEAGLLADGASYVRGPVIEALEFPADCRGVAVPC